MAVVDLLGVLPVLQVQGDKLHGPGPVQGDNGDQVFHALRLGLDEQPLHPRGLELEHPFRMALPQHLEHLGVILGDGVHGEFLLFAADHSGGVVDDRQVPKPQEIHL